MSYDSFHVLCEMIEPHLPSTHTENKVRDAIPSDLALATVRWRLAHGHSSTSLSHLIGIGESTICKYMGIIIRILCSPSMFARHGIVVPTGDRLATIISEFHELTTLPICVAL